MSERTETMLPRRTLLGGALGLIAAAGLPLLSGCTSAESGGSVDLSGKITLLGSDVPRQAVTVADARHLADVVAGIRALGTGLHRVASEATTNWTVSPLSISLAFGMLRAGARGRTARQIDAALGYPLSPAPEGSPPQALNALSAAMVGLGSATPAASGEPSVLDIANGVFLDRTFAPEVRSAYLQLLSREYGADAMAVRFADPSTATTIDEWVSAQTRGRITRLFDHLDPSTVLVLADAVYLKTTWQSQFLQSETTPGPFHRADGGQVDVPMMFQTVPSARYTSTPQWQRISLPYAKHGLAMRIVLPHDTASDVASLTSALTAALAPTTHDITTDVDLTLPRWDTATTVPLGAAMRALGVTDAFDSAADLSGIAPGLFVSDAVHRANVTVDEHGTEAAAVTGIDVAVTGIAVDQPTMTVDRPFAWAVVHEPTGTPVFAGHVVDPSATS